MMTETVRITVLRRGCPLEAMFKRFATTESIVEVADEIVSMLRYEKSVMRGHIRSEHGVYKRLVGCSDFLGPAAPEYTLPHDGRDGIPRRIVFDSVVLEIDGVDVHLVGCEEPFRALWAREFSPGFNSVDLVFEEVVKLRPEGPGSIGDVNTRTSPMDIDVWVVSDLRDTVCHTLMADPEFLPPGFELDRDSVTDYTGDLCISPRYERPVEAVLGTRYLDDVTFAYLNDAPEEEAAIAGTSIGVCLTTTGSTAREHDLVLDEHLFPSETVLMENVAEATPAAETAERVVVSLELETELKV